MFLLRHGQHLVSLYKILCKLDYECSFLSQDTTASPSVGLFGELTCDACFDTAAWIKRPQAQQQQQQQPAAVAGRLAREGGNSKVSTSSPIRTGRDERFQSSVEELRATFQRAGLEKSSPSAPSSPATPRVAKVTVSSPSPLRESPSRGSVAALASRFGGAGGVGGGSDVFGDHSNTTMPATRDSYSSPEVTTTTTTTMNPSKVCAACSLPLFSVGESGKKIIQIPATGEHYHERCFLCAECSRPFGGVGKYVELEEGKKRVHEDCAPPLFHEGRVLGSWKRLPLEEPRVATPTKAPSTPPPAGTYSPSCSPRRPKTSATFVPDNLPRIARESSSLAGRGSTAPTSKAEASAAAEAAAAAARGVIPSLSCASAALSTRSPTKALPRFGGFEVCPVCKGKAILSETVAGPSGRRFHPKCLVCGGCKKKLDAGAKVGDGGATFCRVCFVS
jgi:uncharacterized protein with PIN domain